MKKIFWLLFIGFGLLSCEEVITVPLENAEPQLVVDAVIGVNSFGLDNELAEFGYVRLTLTAPFYDDNVPAATNAVVTIIDESTGTEYPLTESNPGIFDQGFPDLSFGVDYTLEIAYEGEIYRATEQLMRGTEINSVEQGDGFLFDANNETEIIISFDDIPNEDNYFLFSFGFENYIVVSDEFFPNSSLSFSYFYEDLNPQDEITIAVIGVNQSFASYAEQVIEQSGQDGGGFGVVPSSVRGNIVNTSNPENNPFGYFAMGEFDATTFEIQ